MLTVVVTVVVTVTHVVSRFVGTVALQSNTASANDCYSLKQTSWSVPMLTVMFLPRPCNFISRTASWVQTRHLRFSHVLAGSQPFRPARLYLRQPDDRPSCRSQTTTRP